MSKAPGTRHVHASDEAHHQKTAEEAFRRVCHGTDGELPQNRLSKSCARGQGASFTRQELRAGIQGMWRTEIQSSDKVDSDVIEGGLTDIAAPVSVRLT